MKLKQRTDYKLRQQCTAKDLEAICYFNKIIKNYKSMLLLSKNILTLSKYNESSGFAT